MKANKLYPYFVAVNFLMLFLSGATDSIVDGLVFFVVMILLSGVFGVLCKGWRRYFAICFIILGVLMSFRAIYLQRTFDERMERIKKTADNYVKTNTPAASPENNLHK
jgi:uncharacterized membrane protein (DUF106 family)